MKINLFLSILRAVLSYILGQMNNYWPLSKICMVIPIVRNLIIGKILPPIKGAFKVALPTNADKRTIYEANQAKKIIEDNFHDGCKHKRFWKTNSDGSKTIYAKITHANPNPYTGETNVPIESYTNNETFEADEKKLGDKTSFIDQKMNILVDAQLIKEKTNDLAKDKEHKFEFIPDPDQSQISEQVEKKIFNVAKTKPTHKIEREYNCVKEIVKENKKVYFEKNKKLPKIKEVAKSKNIDEVD